MTVALSALFLRGCGCREAGEVGIAGLLRLVGGKLKCAQVPVMPDHGTAIGEIERKTVIVTEG